MNTKNVENDCDRSVSTSDAKTAAVETMKAMASSCKTLPQRAAFHWKRRDENSSDKCPVQRRMLDCEGVKEVGSDALAT